MVQQTSGVPYWCICLHVNCPSVVGQTAHPRLFTSLFHKSYVVLFQNREDTYVIVPLLHMNGRSVSVVADGRHLLFRICFDGLPLSRLNRVQKGN